MCLYLVLVLRLQRERKKKMKEETSPLVDFFFPQWLKHWVKLANGLIFGSCFYVKRLDVKCFNPAALSPAQPGFTSSFSKTICSLKHSHILKYTKLKIYLLFEALNASSLGSVPSRGQFVKHCLLFGNGSAVGPILSFARLITLKHTSMETGY